MDNQQIELVWTIIPAIILIAIVLPSLKLLYLTEELDAKLRIKTVGNQWYWQYEIGGSYNSYLNEGYRLLSVDQRLHLPIIPVQILITAGDVLHSWTLPVIGVKGDAVPGRINKVNLTNKRAGLFFGQCSEICGSNHSFMPIVIETIFNLSSILKIVHTPS